MDAVLTRIYVKDSIVFRWGPSDFDSTQYDTHISMFTARHWDNCKENNNPHPWPFTEIRIKPQHADYIIGQDQLSFETFCDKWLENPNAIVKWTRMEIANRERENSPIKHVQLTDFPYQANVNSPRILDV